MQTRPFDDLLALIDSLFIKDTAASQASFEAKKALEACGFIVEEKAISAEQALEKKSILKGEASQRQDNASLFEISMWLAGAQKRAAPSVKETHLCLLASSYREGAPAAVIRQMIEAISKGRAPVNPLCVRSGLGLRVLEMAPDLPHQIGRAHWSERDYVAATAFGMEAAAAGGHVLGLAAMAPGGEIHALAVMDGLMAFLEKAKKNKLDKTDKIACLAIAQDAGGREIAGLMGAMIAAKTHNLAVVIEGAASLAALMLLSCLSSLAVDHVRFACYDDIIQDRHLAALGLVPLVNVRNQAGPGCGLALAAGVLEGASALFALPNALPLKK